MCSSNERSPEAPCPLVLRGLVNPVASSSYVLLIGLACIGGLIDHEPHTAQNVALIYGVAVFQIAYLVRCFQLRVAANATDIKHYGHFRTRKIRIQDIQRVDVEPYAGWLSLHSETESMWMLELTLKSADPERIGRAVELPVLAARKVKADQMEARLREHIHAVQNPSI